MQIAAKTLIRNHEHPSQGENRQQQDEVAIDPMEEQHAVPNPRHELQRHQHARRQNCREMDQDADLVACLFGVEEAFSGCSTGLVPVAAPAEHAIEVEVDGPREGEAEQGTAEDKE